MILETRLMGKTYRFKDLRDLFAKANESNTGDMLAMISAMSNTERIAAKMILSELTLNEIRFNPILDWCYDEVSRVGEELLDNIKFNQIKHMTLGELREFLLKSAGEEIAEMRDGLNAEMIAGVVKLMSNLDLITIASKLQVKVMCNTVLGDSDVLASGIQLHYCDDKADDFILALSAGMSYGVGDAFVGVNFENSDLMAVTNAAKHLKRFSERSEVPFQSCMFTDLSTQVAAIKSGAAFDMMYQCIAGTELANYHYGVNKETLDETYAFMKDHKCSKGDNFMYFETGQSSEYAFGSHSGLDQVTLTARSYQFAKRYNPFIVNTKLGLLGDECLYNGKQLIRSSLENIVMGKLVGVSVGIDFDFTGRIIVDRNDIDNLLAMIAATGCSFLSGGLISINDGNSNQAYDFTDIVAIRSAFGKRAVKSFEESMMKRGIMTDGKLTENAGKISIFLNCINEMH